MSAAILTVTLNPTLDVSTSVPKLIDHDKLRCSPEREQVGGGGINVSHVLDSLGANCKTMLPVGGSRGQDILQRLNASGLDCVTAAITEQSRQCFTVYESETGHEYRFVLPGPTLTASEQDACLSVICGNLPSQFLVLSGSLPPGVPEDFYARVIRAVHQKAPALRVVVDASGPALAHALDAGVYLFKPSLEEFRALVQPQIAAKADLAVCVAAARELISTGKSEVVALTLGAQGALLVTDTHAWHIPPMPVKVTSTVGAGDSFVGGLVWSLTQNDDLPQAAKVGTAAAVAALQTQGELRFAGNDILRTSTAVAVTPIR